MRPFYMAVFVKDFAWQKGAKGWQPEWCPLGEGTVHAEFFQTLKKSGYSGPISQHHEYEVGSGTAMGSRPCGKKPRRVEALAGHGMSPHSEAKVFAPLPAPSHLFADGPGLSPGRI